MTKRKGDWQQMFTGRAVWPIDPRPEDVDIRDIAHALSLQCRFGGHTRWHYSVAQHSLLVLRFLESEEFYDAYADATRGDDDDDDDDQDSIGGDVLQRTGLLHDASEAYLVDVPRPLKLSLPDYKEHEVRWEAVIAEKFGLAHPMPKIVKFADNMALALERDNLFSVPPMVWEPLPEVPIEFRTGIDRMPWQSVEHNFLKAYYELCSEDDEDDE